MSYIASRNSIQAICLYCEEEFQGRPRRLYCSHRCKKNAENERAKLERLIDRQPRLASAEKEALRCCDHADLRFIRQRRKRDLEEIEALLDKPFIGIGTQFKEVSINA